MPPWGPVYRPPRCPLSGLLPRLGCPGLARLSKAVVPALGHDHVIDDLDANHFAGRPQTVCDLPIFRTR